MSQVTIRTALTHNYTCPECGQVLEVKELAAEMQQIEKDLARLQTLLQTVQEEVQIISVKEGKARERRIQADVRKKKVERAIQKKARASASALAKKSSAAPTRKPALKSVSKSVHKRTKK